MEQQQTRTRLQSVTSGISGVSAFSAVSSTNNTDKNSSSKSAAIRLLRQLTQAQRSKKVQALQYKIKTLAGVNDNLQQAIQKKQPDLQIFGEEKLIIYIRYCFIENIFKTEPIRYLRLAMLNQSIVKKYLTQNIPLYLSRVIERDDNTRPVKNLAGGSSQQQVLQVLKLINVWICKFGYLFPKYLAGCLIAYAELPILGDDRKKQTKIPGTYKVFAADIVMNLAIHNTKLCCWSGGFGVLINCILDPLFVQKSTDILHKLIYFYNESHNRAMISQYIDLRKVFHVFTDLDNSFAEEAIKSKGGFDGINRYQQQLYLAKAAIMSMLKSWTGLIYIGSEGTILRSFLQALKQIPKKQSFEVRNVMFSILEEILSIGDNFLTESQKKQTPNKLKISSLINSYLMTLLQLLIDNNLFRILIELSSMDEYSLAEPAQKLLKKLTILIFNFFPDSSKYVDFLITAATTSNSESLILKSASSFVVNKIGNYIYDTKQIPYNKLLGQLETLFSSNTMHSDFARSSTESVLQTLNFITHRELEGRYRKSLLDKEIVTKENKDLPTKWKWDLIQDFLRCPSVEKMAGYKSDSNEKYKEGKLFKYLLRYYTPSKSLFLNQKWLSENFQWIKVGQLMIQNTIVLPDFVTLLINPGFSQFQITINFVGELEKLLTKVLESLSQNPKEFYMPFYKQCERELILWIPLFSSTKLGFTSLLCENNFFQILYSYVQVPSCANFLATILHHMDFYRDNMSKKKASNTGMGESGKDSPMVKTMSLNTLIKNDITSEKESIIVGPKMLLEKAVIQGSKALVLASVEIVKILFKAELLNYRAEGFKLLLIMLKKNDSQILERTLQLLQELLRQKQNLIEFLKLLKQNKVFDTIKNQLSDQIVIMMLSVEEGYSLVEKSVPGWLEEQYDHWIKKQQSHSYCLKLQALLDTSLNFTKKLHTGFKIITHKSFLQLLYLYRLPWIVYLNENQYPLGVRHSNKKFILYIDFVSSGNSTFRVKSRRLDVALGIGAMFVNQNFREVATKHPFTVSMVANQSPDDTSFMTASHGISVYYNKEDGSNYQIRKLEIQIMLESSQENKELPLHLIKKLSNTQSGIKFLCQKQFLRDASQRLDKSESLIQIRSVLWSLGYFGSTSQGSKEIIQSGILNKIITMSLKCDTLSLRGTCRYVLNMLCHSQMGRNYIQSCDYNVNKKCLTCFPKNSKVFFNIDSKETDKATIQIHHSLDESYWAKYNLQPMNESNYCFIKDETKIFKEISKLINNYLSSKSAMGEIRQIEKNNHKIWFSVSLFKNVMSLIAYHKFRHDAKKKVIWFFDELIRSPEFNNEVQGKINYFLIP